MRLRSRKLSTDELVGHVVDMWPAENVNRVVVENIWTQSRPSLVSFLKVYGEYMAIKLHAQKQIKPTDGKWIQTKRTPCYNMTRILSNNDRNAVLARTFPTMLSAQCGFDGCNQIVNAMRCKIVGPLRYTTGDVSKLRVVCAAHAKITKPARRLVFDVAINPQLVDTWLHRVGFASKTACAICGTCQLWLWGSTTQNCHCVSLALGGSDDLNNRVVGSAGCNSQQGVQPLDTFRRRIAVSTKSPGVAIPADLIPLIKRSIIYFFFGKFLATSATLSRHARSSLALRRGHTKKQL